MSGTLYLVPVPIGNPGDITLRALETLRRVGLVAAEDTRHFATLQRAHGLKGRALSLHDHNYSTRYPELAAILASDPSAPKHNLVAHNIRWGGVWIKLQDGANDSFVASDAEAIQASSRLRASRRIALRTIGDHPRSTPFFPSAIRLHRQRSKTSRCEAIVPSMNVNVAWISLCTGRPVEV